MGDALLIQNLSVRYHPDRLALAAASFRIPRGQILVLLGRSGAGKSTLLRCLNGLVTPTGGSVATDDLGEVTSGPALRAHRRRTGMIFQHHQLIRRHTAWANVLVGRLARYPIWRSLWPLPRPDRILALECLERVGLLDKALQRCDQLSGGEQQRVGVARALAQEPTLILADEPVASLDPSTALELLEQLRAICESDGITLVMSLHQVALARRFAHRIVGLRGGHIVFDGAPDALDEAAQQRIYTLSESPAPAPNRRSEPRSAPHRAASHPLTLHPEPIENP